jgi:hypothetical protein
MIATFRVPADWCYNCGYRYMIWPDGACRGVLRCIFRPLTADERKRLSA